jgi:hypothetical protein
MAWLYRGRKEVAEAIAVQIAPLSVIRYIGYLVSGMC